MTNLKLFENPQFGQVRTLEENGTVLFSGKDIATALGYAIPRKAILDHCRGVLKRNVPHPQSNDKQLEITFITEGDLYRLIVNSRLPSAEQFEHWVFDEVLPTIRKTGGYVSNEDTFINTYLPFADEQTKLLFRTTLETVKSLNHKIEQDKPKVLFADAVNTARTSILIGDLEKLIKQNGVEIGQKRLFDWLRNNGYLMKYGSSRNMPTQKSMEMDLFEVKESTINNPDGSVRITKTPKITGRGQVYFVNKFLN
jgi:anti-repressor protein